jgi:hypothetical protein
VSDNDKDSSPGWIERLANRLGELMALQEERVRSQIAAGLVETRNAVRLQGSRSEMLTASRRLSGGDARLVGWSIRADSGPASVTFYDGSAESLGDVLAVVDLIDAESETQHLGGGVSITNGCYAQVVGTVTGAVYFGAKD